MKIINVALIFDHSTRSYAYLNLFKKLGTYPAEIIFLRKKNNIIPSELHNASIKYNYSKRFFSFQKFSLNKNTKVYKVNTININNINVKNTLSKLKSNLIIFSGGGILNKKILNIKNKRFIHVHPGDTRYYRGSTCFYYSYLNENKIACTSFFMSKKIDAGSVIEINYFKVNIKLDFKQKFFIDYIFDPYIRSLSLEKILIKLKNHNKLVSNNLSSINENYCFIIHPILRAKFTKKIMRNYKNKLKESVLII